MRPVRTVATALLGIGIATPAHAYTHVVVVLIENRDYREVIGNPASAPYINGPLRHLGMVLTNSLAVGHPSQPNYLQLFSGSAQGMQGSDGPVPGSVAPAGAPPTGTGLEGPNLGAAVRQAGGSYATYAESLALAADKLAYFAGGRSGQLYARKHNPAANWISASPHGNQLPDGVNQDFAAFKSTPFAQLPTLAFVIPNQCSDAHGADPDCPYANHEANVTLADTWLKANLDAYARWAAANDSLLILTADEGNTDIGTDQPTGLPLSRVPTILVGAGIAAGSTYGGKIDHFGMCAFIAASVHASAPARCAAADAQAEAAALARAIATPP